jgi:lipopolysaccharide transport system permease protein
MSETVYSAQSELARPGWFVAEGARDVGRSLPVAWRLFLSNVQTRYRRSWLGALWLLLPTVGTTLVWGYVQSRGIVVSAPTGVPYPVYVLSGTILWQVFVDALNMPLQQLTVGRQMITRSRVPHEALVVAGMLEVLLNCAVRLLVLGVVLFTYRIPVDTTLLLVPVGIVALALLGLTVGLLAAPAGMLYDDVSRGIALVTSFWIFLTPVLYATPRWGILRFNPVTPLLDTTRAWLTSGPATSGFAMVTAVTIPALVLAWLFNRLARPHVVARLG